MSVFVRRCAGVLLAMLAMVVLGLPSAPVARADGGGSVSGVVVDADGSPVAGATVTACRYWQQWDGQWSACYGNSGASWTTDEHGAFSIPADQFTSGAIYQVSASLAGYFRAWIGGHEGQDSLTDRSDGFVYDGSAKELANLVMHKSYSLSGYVTDSRSDAVPSLTVGLYPDADHLAAADAISTTRTTSDGSYGLPIPYAAHAEEYTLAVTDSSGVLPTFTRSVTVSQENAVQDTIRLDGIGSFIRGCVVDSGGNPLEGVEVRSLRSHSEFAGGTPFWVLVHTVTTHSSGCYAVAVAPGQQYSIAWSKDGYETRSIAGSQPGDDAPADAPVANGVPDAGPFVPNPDRSAPTVLQRVSTVSIRVVRSDTGGPATDLIPSYAVYRSGEAETGVPVLSDYGLQPGGRQTLSLPNGTYDIVFSGDAVVRTVVRDKIVDGVSDWGTMEVEPAGNSISGIVSSGGAPVGGAVVTAYYRDEYQPEPDSTVGIWVRYAEARADLSGHFSMILTDGKDFTFRAQASGYAPVWLGGGSIQPAGPGGSVSVTSGPELAPVALELQPSTGRLGSVAGQNLSYCHANRLSPEELDEPIALPFTANFFGSSFDHAVITPSGTLEFDNTSWLDYDPASFAEVNWPIIAPLRAATDWVNGLGVADGTGLVSYGSSADNKTFCVVWEGMRSRDAAVTGQNTFQVLLTEQSGEDGRSSGDFDITINYDQVQWDRFWSSDGSGALAGFSAGSGTPGTWVDLGSPVASGVITDAGTAPLIEGSANSAQPGRYIYPVRNVDLGSAFGKVVTTSTGAGVAGVRVNACKVGSLRCDLTTTSQSGDFSFPSLPAGLYRFYLYPDAPLSALSWQARVEVGASTDLGATQLSKLTPLPDSVTLLHHADVDGVPVVFAGENLPLTVANPCSSGLAAGTWKVVGEDGETVSQGDLGVSGDKLTATVPKLYPYHGQGQVETAVTCDGAAADSPSFDLYVDPSGTVYDRYGTPVDGATVMLSRSDTADGVQAVLPSGSEMMSPSNRVNPGVTSTDGSFHWDVLGGYYQLSVSKAGCTEQTSQVMAVPPKQVGLAFKLDCGSAPAPTAPVTITGDPSLGTTLSAGAAGFGDGSVFASQGLAWMRDDVQIATGATHTVTADDLGHSLRVVETVGAPAVDDGLSGSLTFDTFELRSAPLALARLSFSTVPKPVVGGAVVEGSVLSASVGAWSPAPDGSSLQWLRDGSSIPGATGDHYTLGTADVGATVSVRLRGWRLGYEDGTSTSDSTAKVALATVPVQDFTSRPAPTVTGTVKIGSTLTVKPGVWVPTPDDLDFQWLRAGASIPGATSASYQVQPLDAGTVLSVRVTAFRNGFNQATATSAATVKVPFLGAIKAATPKVAGTAKVGRVLKAKPGTWKPSGVALSYQWLRSGHPIAGATRTTYKLLPADKGRKISVRVTGSKAGYPTVTVTSRKPGKVR